MSFKKLSVLLAILLIASLVLTACPAPGLPGAEKEVTRVVEVKVVETQEVIKEVKVVETKEVVKEVEKIVAAEDYTTPHPILSDVRVRQAIAYCINRDEMIASVYPWLPEADRAKLRMDTFVPKSHWAWSGPYEAYDYSVEKGAALLDEAGWKAAEEGAIRTNANGDALALKYTTTTSAMRQTYAAVMEQNLLKCGIQLIRQHVPASWWFGDTTGLSRRDFELGGFAWVGEPEPGGRTLYACNQIPLPSNNWVGQNQMGWCNKTASDAIVKAFNTLVKAERIKAFDVVHKEFAKDMVSLPLFQRTEGEAWSKNVTGIKIDPTFYGTASAAEWARTDGGDIIIVGFSQEPASLFTLVENAAVAVMASHLAKGVYYTKFNYDFQPALQNPLSTIESGLAKNDTVEMKAGDTVYNTSGEPVKLEKDVKVFDADGNEVTYDGSAALKMKQLTVTYKIKDYTWSDGTKGSVADLELGVKIACDKESGATSFITCDAVLDKQFGPGLEYTIKYVPGFQDPTYYLLPWEQIYPAHQVIADGRKLADVPAAEWTTLREIAEQPLSFGPFMITEWKKGESMTFEANPYADPAPKVKKIVIVIVQDTNQAVAQLLSGDLDYLEKATLGAGPEVETVLKAGAEGKINVEFIANPTWEHVDFNLFTK